MPETVVGVPYLTTVAEASRETAGTTAGTTVSTFTVPRKVLAFWFGSEYG